MGMKRYFSPNKFLFYIFSFSLFGLFYYFISIEEIYFAEVPPGYNGPIPNSNASSRIKDKYVVELQFDSILSLIGCFKINKTMDWARQANVSANQSLFWHLRNLPGSKKPNELRNCATLCQARHLPFIAMHSDLCGCIETVEVFDKFFPEAEMLKSCTNRTIKFTLSNKTFRQNQPLQIGTNSTLVLYRQLVRVPPTQGKKTSTQFVN